MSIRLHLKLLLHKNECNHAKRSFYILLSNFLKILKKLILKMYNIYYDFKRETRKDNETETYI